MSLKDAELIFKYIAYPKERGDPPVIRDGSGIQYLARFDHNEFTQALQYMGKLTRPETKTRLRRVYLDAAGTLFHVEVPKPRKKEKDERRQR